ncbi:MAG: class I SAM-dependent methyltransferase [Acidimicrobiales bacterium]
MADAAHWDERYRTVGSTHVSWFEPRAGLSLELLDAVGATAERSVIDVGGGASVLVDDLLARGFHDLAVLDLSAVALAEARARVGEDAPVTWIEHELTSWVPPRRWDVWHDRAVIHFLAKDEERAAYRQVLRAALEPGGAFVIGAFAPEGPTHCSGLEVRRQRFEDLEEVVGPSVVVERRHHVHVTPGGAPQPFNWIAGHLIG